MLWELGIFVNVLTQCSSGYWNCVTHEILEAEVSNSKNSYSLQRFVAATDLQCSIAEICHSHSMPFLKKYRKFS